MSQYKFTKKCVLRCTVGDRINKCCSVASKKGITRKIRMLRFVLITSVLFNLLCVWIFLNMLWLGHVSRVCSTVLFPRHTAWSVSTGQCVLLNMLYLGHVSRVCSTVLFPRHTAWSVSTGQFPRHTAWSVSTGQFPRHTAWSVSTGQCVLLNMLYLGHVSRMCPLSGSPDHRDIGVN